MMRVAVIWLLVAALTGAGVINVLGVAGTRANFTRWGYPGWWNYPTGGLEIAIAVLIAIPATRTIGMMLGAAVIAAAIATVLWHRDFSHLAPLGLFVLLLALGLRFALT